MRVTDVRFTHNMFRHFKFLWQLGRNRRVGSTGNRQLLEELGIKVKNPEEFLSTAYELPKHEDFFPPPPPPPEPKETLHLISESFSPLYVKGLTLAQHLSWSVTSDSLPESVTDRQRLLSKEELRLVEQDILSSHLLDATKELVPNLLNRELPNKLEKAPPKYDIPMKRKNELLTHALLDTFDQTGLDPLQLLCRPQLRDVTFTCTFRHSGSLVQLQLPCPGLVCSPTTLPCVSARGETNLFVAPEVDDKTMRKILRKQIRAETGGRLQQPLPSIHPLLPFIGAKKLEQYDDVGVKYVTSAPHCHPHTLYLHHNRVPLALDRTQLTALTLVHLHGLALAWATASGAEVDSKGHLLHPIVVQGVHSHLNLFQPAVFQLNTLGPLCVPVSHASATGVQNASTVIPPSPASQTAVSTPGGKTLIESSHFKLNPEDVASGSNLRNVFYYRPFDELYKTCRYNETGRPELVAVNTELVKILRALHETGLEA